MVLNALNLTSFNGKQVPSQQKENGPIQSNSFKPISFIYTHSMLDYRAWKTSMAIPNMYV